MCAFFVFFQFQFVAKSQSQYLICFQYKCGAQTLSLSHIINWVCLTNEWWCDRCIFRLNSIPKHIILGGLLYYSWQFVFLFRLNCTHRFSRQSFTFLRISKGLKHTHTNSVCRRLKRINSLAENSAVFLWCVHSEDAC